AYADGAPTSGNWHISRAIGNWNTGSTILGMNINANLYPNRSGNSIGFSEGKFWLKHLEVNSGEYSDVFSTMNAEGSTVFQEVGRLRVTAQSSPLQFFQMGTGTGYIEPGESRYRRMHRATADAGGSWQNVLRGMFFPGSGSSLPPF